MKAAFNMWGNTRMIILVAVCAAIYSAALLAFKTAIPLIPGITEVRVANIFPMVLGMLFGPAGAWGAAIGNLIGDTFGGTLTPASIAGFVGNFLLAYLPYAMWMTFLPFTVKSREWNPSRWRNWVNYFMIGFISSTACAVVISISVDTLGIVPYAVLTKIITVNDTIGSYVGVILLMSVFRPTKQLGLFWADIMEEREISQPIAGTFGAWLVTVAAVAGLLGGVINVPAATGWMCTLAIMGGCCLL